MTSVVHLRRERPRFPLVRALVRGPGYAVAREAAPGYLGLLVVVGVVFGGNGLHPRTIAEWATHHPFGLPALCSVWVVFSARAYRAFARDEAWALLRTFPLRALPLVLTLLLALFVLEMPWFVFWVIGHTLCAGVLLTLLCAGLSLAWLPLSEMWTLRVAYMVLVWLIGARANASLARNQDMGINGDHPVIEMILLTVSAVVLGAFTSRRVWHRLLEQTGTAASATKVHRPLVALTRAYACSLNRGSGRIILASTLLFIGVVSLASVLFGRPQERLETQIAFTACAFCVAAVVSTVAMSISLRREIERSHWVTSSSAVRDVTHRLAQALPLILYECGWITVGIMLVAVRQKLNVPVAFELLGNTLSVGGGLAACVAVLMPAIHRRAHSARWALGLVVVAVSIGATLSYSSYGALAGAATWLTASLVICWPVHRGSAHASGSLRAGQTR